VAEFEQLIDQITAAVKARLGEEDSPRRHGGTEKAEGCAGCGMCPNQDRREADTFAVLGAARFGTPMLPAKPCEGLHCLIDHTLLKADATRDEVKKLCDEARKHEFASVCVNSGNARYAATLLTGTNVLVCAVVGFPLGAATGAAKAFEAKEAIRAGAREIDMVMNVGAMKSGDYATVLDDICKVVQASRPNAVKVILETGLLSHDQKVAGCVLAKVGGAAFVKTSTGFNNTTGATVEDIELMRRLVGDEMGVKASGGIRTKDDAEKMVRAGANRLGASASVAIVTGKKGTSAY
jgi:deoxyribose-phosphate aldolase